MPVQKMAEHPNALFKKPIFQHLLENIPEGRRTSYIYFPIVPWEFIPFLLENGNTGERSDSWTFVLQLHLGNFPILYYITLDLYGIFFYEFLNFSSAVKKKYIVESDRDVLFLNGTILQDGLSSLFSGLLNATVKNFNITSCYKKEMN